jgi:hypothetical protein
MLSITPSGLDSYECERLDSINISQKEDHAKDCLQYYSEQQPANEVFGTW